MLVIISINCSNAAFEPRPEGELSKILGTLAGRLAEGELSDWPVIRDSNGNTVGQVEVLNES